MVRSVAIAEATWGHDHPALAFPISYLARLRRSQHQTEAAEMLFKRALALMEKSLGLNHPSVAMSLNDLAEMYRERGRDAEAEPLFLRNLAIWRTALGADHPYPGLALVNLAGLALKRGDLPRAASFLTESAAQIQRRVARGVTEVRQSSFDGELSKESWQFSGLIKIVDRIATEDRDRVAAEMFVAAQWALSSAAAASLAQMSVRGAAGSPELAAIVRERQDLAAEWQAKDRLLIAAKSKGLAVRNLVAETALGERLAAVDVRLSEIDARLSIDFPNFAGLMSAKAVSVADVQTQLRANEALVLFLDTFGFEQLPGETFVWVVTKDNLRWVRVQLGTEALAEEIAALRCGLDYDGMWATPENRCSALVGVTYTANDRGAGKLLPFDLDRARRLYATLFGQIEDLIKDKQLLIVPSGALTQLPFQVLITALPELPATGAHAFQNAAWLARRNSLTVLPSVSSLKGLRVLAKPSHASRPLIGFGNPLLNGRDSSHRRRASAARSRQVCTDVSERRMAALAGDLRGVLPLTLRGGLADVAHILIQAPLPETADELCAVARSLGADGTDIRLGAHATETEIGRLNKDGELSKYRIVHFATHGALAGQISGNSEPGLLLTPPPVATAADDGYLTASEIAGLKLDADWVILSACNTAAGGADTAEALSGLARAFFYAGARALLVSHWSVDSDATVKLITGALRRMASDKGLGRAEAMRQSMLALIDNGEQHEAHPSYWAPFVVVGEGAAAN